MCKVEKMGMPQDGKGEAERGGRVEPWKMFRRNFIQTDRVRPGNDCNKVDQGAEHYSSVLDTWWAESEEA